MKKWLAGLVAVIMTVVLAACDSAPADSGASVQTSGESEQSSASPVSEEETTGQKNARKKAESYLELMPFSYQGLIDQLEFDQFTHEDAVYAADNCGADWKEQAARKAETYLELMSFSKEKLIEQLEHDGFTHEEAVYGAQANGY